MMLLGVALALALVGVPVFAVMGGTTALAWLAHPSVALAHVRFVAPDVLDERFLGNPVLVTVPLFTFVGTLMAASGAPGRIVRASNAFLGWLPGGLAIVCIFSSAFFTSLSGGSAVTIVAIGALLLPSLIAEGYPKNYALGLVMTGGSLGLLLPPSIPVVVYAFVAGVDFTMAFKALLIPGLLIMVILCAHAAWIAVRRNLPRRRPDLAEMREAAWLIKWEAGLPLLIIGGLAAGVGIDEIAGLAALYAVVVEVLVLRDVPAKKLPEVTGRSVALAGAVMVIMAMAMGLTNYIVNEQLPERLLAAVTEGGVTTTWQFLVALNVILYVLGMVMDGFSSILVAVPLLIPFAAKFMLSPFHLAAMFLLNLEIAYLSPPLGQNLFVASFRFDQPMARLYRVALPFVGILLVALVQIMAFPWLSTVAVEGDIRRAYAEARRTGAVPREAYSLECVQEDRNDPKPCDAEDRRRLEADRAGKDDDLEELFADDG